MKVKEIIKMLEEDGWVLQRIKGDHRIYFKKRQGDNSSAW